MVCIKAFRTQTATNLDKIKRVGTDPLLRWLRGLTPPKIRGSTVTSWRGSMFHTRTSYPSSAFRRRCSRFA